MTYVRIATSAEQPVNRDGGVSQYAGEEGDLVGMNSNGDLVMADADSATAVNAIGVLAAPVTDPSNYNHDVVKSQVEANRELLGEDRVSVVEYGIFLVNSDEDWGFTPGEPVYLDTGGGFTQTKPSNAGDVQQVVGIATDDGEVVFLDVDYGYSTA